MVRAKKASLPVQQLTILAICRFAEPVASTSVYPYIPEMIQSFNVPINQVAKYSGWLSACFSLSQCLTAIAWGRASDRLGRKPMILLALTCIMIGTFLFGFSNSLVMAFVTRSLQGLSSGNVGIIRTSVAEMVPQRDLQPRAFSIMPLVWNIGSIFGPSLGGSLVQPVERYGGLFKKFPILEDYPFAFPNIIISILFMIGIVSGFLFLHETHQDKKHRRDYGLLLGKLITRSCTGLRIRRSTLLHSEEAEPFLGESGSPMTDPGTPRRKPVPKRQATGWKEVFSPQSNVNLIAYTGLAMHSIAFDQILPVFLNYPTNDHLEAPVQAPFKFSGGFGLKSPRIGLLFTIYGFFGMLVQFLVFPYVARRYGVLRCFKACALTFPVVYILMPFTSLIETDGGRQAACLGLMLIKCAAGIFAFPCSTILLTNSASSLQILGTLNGVATSVSAIGRAAGPALAGAAFTMGVRLGYILVPFWALAFVSIIAAMPIWWLIEMEGFSAEDRDDDEDGEDAFDDDEDEQGHEGGLLLDSDAQRAANGDSIRVSGVDATTVPHDDMQRSSPTTTHESQQSQKSSSKSSLTRVTSPVGTGQGIVVSGARRYSSDLGTSRAGMGTGGSSFH